MSRQPSQSPLVEGVAQPVHKYCANPSSVTITVRPAKIEVVTSDGEVLEVPVAAEKAMEKFLLAVGLDASALVNHHPVFTVEEVRRNHASAYLPWTPDQEADLTRRFLAGEAVPDIAVTMGRKPGGIQARLGRLGMGKGSMP